MTWYYLVWLESHLCPYIWLVSNFCIINNYYKGPTWQHIPANRSWNCWFHSTIHHMHCPEKNNNSFITYTDRKESYVQKMVQNSHLQVNQSLCVQNWNTNPSSVHPNISPPPSPVTFSSMENDWSWHTIVEKLIQICLINYQTNWILESQNTTQG